MNRRTWMLGAGVGLAGMAALTGGMVVYRGAHAASRDGAALLAVVLPDVDGKDQAIGQWRGKVLVVNFWATWCPPCREEMPQFVAAQGRDAGRGLQFVGIAVDQPTKVRQFAKEIGLNYPALIGGYGAIELSRALGNTVAALPFTVVIDRSGRVVRRQLGPLVPGSLDPLLNTLLGEA